MTDYRTTEQTALIDLLSKYTSDYTKLLTENGNRSQLENLQHEIVAIQKEVKYREKFSKYSNASSDYITFNDADIV